ncbi:DMT family transporter [Gottfriedia solisilvae]|uniref:Membrane protein n=1 Tax=Gottfriedia solisilvae TaxID=1516104 RepID=A0A8J3AKH6_9BACI|nr:DMT family transporter [Gottfriedia solisilvae]GGI12371.1 membrane protein [Gottfriedia solisilvae]
MKNKMIAFTSLLIVSFFWGSSFFIVKESLTIVQPFTFNAIRFIVAAIILFFVQTLSERKRDKRFHEKAGYVFPGILIGLFLFLGYVFQTYGLQHTTISNAGFIVGISVVVVPLLLFFKYNKKPTMPETISAVIALCGLLFITITNNTSHFNFGDFITFFSAIAFALHIIYSTIYAPSYNSLKLTTIQIAFVGLASWTFALVFEDWQVIFNQELWTNKFFIFSILFTALFCTALAFFIQMFAQRTISATEVGIILATEPVFAAIAGYYYGGERLTEIGLIGCILILASIILTQLKLKKHKHEQYKDEKTIHKM